MGDTKWNGANIHVGQGQRGGGQISPEGQRQGYPGPNEPAFGRSQRGFIRQPAGDTDSSVARGSSDPDRGTMTPRGANTRGAGQMPNARKPKGY